MLASNMWARVRVEWAWCMLMGRGISPSSIFRYDTLVWVAVYDILLDLLQPVIEQDGSLNAYTDDLASVTTGPNSFQNHQKIAALISAFCAITGMQLNYKTIVLVSIGNSGIRSPTAALQLFDHNCWNQIPIYFKKPKRFNLSCGTLRSLHIKTTTY